MRAETNSEALAFAGEHAPRAPQASGHERGHAVRPEVRAVVQGTTLYAGGATENLSGSNVRGFHLIVASHEKERPARHAATSLKSMRDDVVRGRREEHDVADAQVRRKNRFHGDAVAVAYERGHAGSASREPDRLVGGQAIPRHAVEERCVRVEQVGVHGARPQGKDRADAAD